MKRLLLAGGGHAHLQVLRRLATQRLAGWEIVLVTPCPTQIYSGMLPGWVAGHYRLEACTIALDRLARQAGVRLHLGRLCGVDVQAGRVECDDGARLSFDLLSLDTGSQTASETIEGAAEHAVAVRPIEGLAQHWPQWLQQARRQPSFEGVIVGDGAAAVELALAMQHRFAAEGLDGARITLVGRHARLLPGLPRAAASRCAELFARRRILWYAGTAVMRVQPGCVTLADGRALPADGCLLATGAAAPRWPRESGLVVDEAGFVRVGATLQSVSHAQVFAAGDLAAGDETHPRSGVFAVRAGPVLAANLRAAALGRPLQHWKPQRRALYLLSTADHHAIGAWDRWTFSGHWVWRWKDRIDRQFVSGFSAVATRS